MTKKIIKAANAVVRSEVASLRHRAADGYALVDAKALDELKRQLTLDAFAAVKKASPDTELLHECIEAIPYLINMCNDKVSDGIRAEAIAKATALNRKITARLGHATARRSNGRSALGS